MVDGKRFDLIPCGSGGGGGSDILSRANCRRAGSAVVDSCMIAGDATVGSVGSSLACTCMGFIMLNLTMDFAMMKVGSRT